MRHRNTRRRPYRPFGTYFITTNVSGRLAILDTQIYGCLLEHILHLSGQIHQVKLIAYKINPDHLHLLAQIGKRGTISEYVGSWKRQFSRQVNALPLQRLPNGPYIPGGDSNPRLECGQKFRWQPSYHSHLITSRRDFDNHIQYILNQAKHHELPENRFCYVDETHVFKFV